MSEFIFPSDLNHLKQDSQKVIDDISSHKIDPSDLIDIKLCFEEAFINAVKHGNRFDSNLKVKVKVVIDKKSIELYISDEGEGFDLDKCLDPTRKENLKKPHGRGVFIIKKIMDETNYNKSNKSLIIKKYFKK